MSLVTMNPLISHLTSNGESSFRVSAIVGTNIFKNPIDEANSKIINRNTLMRSFEFKRAFNSDVHSPIFYEIFSLMTFTRYWDLITSIISAITFLFLFSQAPAFETGKNILSIVLYLILVVVMATSIFSLFMLTRFKAPHFNLILRFYPFNKIRILLVFLLGLSFFFAFIPYTSSVSETQEMIYDLFLLKMDISPICLFLLIGFCIVLLLNYFPGSRKRECFLLSFLVFHMIVLTLAMLILIGMYNFEIILASGKYVLKEY